MTGAHVHWPPTEERFWAKVEKTETCWLWVGATHPTGYGGFWWNRKGGYAHRYSYELHVGPIPQGLTIDHLCRIRNCVNPEHLEAVTNRENILRGTSMSARNAKVTHCPRGHGYEGYNLIVHRGGRWCRACNLLAGKRSRAMAKAAR